jgi:hypothetical protein
VVRNAGSSSLDLQTLGAYLPIDSIDDTEIDWESMAWTLYWSDPMQIQEYAITFIAGSYRLWVLRQYQLSRPSVYLVVDAGVSAMIIIILTRPTHLQSRWKIRYTDTLQLCVV